MSSSKKQAKLAREAKRDRENASGRGQSADYRIRRVSSAMGGTSISGDPLAAELLKAAGVNVEQVLKACRRELKKLSATQIRLAAKLEVVLQASTSVGIHESEGNLVDLEKEARLALTAYKDNVVRAQGDIPNSFVHTGAERAMLILLLRVAHHLSENFQKKIKYHLMVVDTATEELAVALLLEGQKKDVSSSEDSDSPMLSSQSLLIRGRALTHLQRFDEAIEDLASAAATSYREMGTATPTPYQTAGQEGKVENQCVTPLFIAMALQKRHQNAPRPHYTYEEKREIEKKYRLRDFSDQLFQCSKCEAVPTAINGVVLRFCSRCQGPRYCSKACQKLSWADGHKKDCKLEAESDSNALGGLVWVDPTTVEVMKEVCESVGYDVLDHRLGPTVVLHDSQTGEYFESLTNKRVISMDEMPEGLTLSFTEESVEATRHALRAGRQLREQRDRARDSTGSENKRDD